jgi:hypothetical protein
MVWGGMEYRIRSYSTNPVVRTRVVIRSGYSAAGMVSEERRSRSADIRSAGIWFVARLPPK